MVNLPSNPSSAALEQCQRRKVVEAAHRAGARKAGPSHGGVGKSRRRGDGGRAVGAGLAVLALVCLSGWAEFVEGGGGGGGSADLNIPRRVRADDPTLQRAVDAYRQARQLDSQLKTSEQAVESQTRTLRGELKRSRVAESTSKDPAFRKEVKMDEDLLNQAETETQRDKKLVRQAEGEMTGDKKFLEDAYSRDRKAHDCPATACRDARAAGKAPRSCTISDQGDCPRISCLDYQETGRCSSGRVCSRPSSRAPGCDYGGDGPKSWTRSSCPGMHCAHAKSAGYSPAFCTAMVGEGGCPQLACHSYTAQTDCTGAPEQGFSSGRVCMKAERVPGCTGAVRSSSSSRASSGRGGAGGAGRGGGGSAGQSMAAVSPMHDQHASKSAWSAPKSVETRMPSSQGMLILLLIMSAGTIGAYILFRRHGAGQRSLKKPSPVPAYYGRL